MTTFHPLNTKHVNVTPPAAIVNNGSFTTNEIDTIGYEYATIVVTLGATDVAMAALKLQESDTSGSGFADISGLDYTGSLPGATDDNKVYTFNVDLKGRKRYLDLVMTAGNGTTGTFASAVCILSRAKVAPESASDQGLGGRLIA